MIHLLNNSRSRWGGVLIECLVANLELDPKTLCLSSGESTSPIIATYFQPFNITRSQLLAILAQKLKRPLVLAKDCRYMCLASWLDADLEGKGSLQNPRIIRLRVKMHDLASLGIRRLGELKGPEELGGNAPHVTLREVNSWADSPARPVVVVVAVGPVRASGVVVCKPWVLGVSVRVEGFGIFVDVLVVVDCPGWDKDGGVLGDQHALVLVV